MIEEGIGNGVYFFCVLMFIFLLYLLNSVLEKICGKWSVVILCLIFFSVGFYGGYWLGDNIVLFNDLYFFILGKCV